MAQFNADLLTHEKGLTACRFEQVKYSSSHSGLSAAGFSNQPQGLLIVNMEGNIIYGTNVPNCPPEYFPFNGKVLS